MTRRERYNLALNCVAKVGVGSPDLQKEFARAMSTFEASGVFASMQPPPMPSMGSATPPMGTNEPTEPTMSQQGSITPGMPQEGMV